jgi:hypothetical protein
VWVWGFSFQVYGLGIWGLEVENALVLPGGFQVGVWQFGCLLEGLGFTRTCLGASTMGADGGSVEECDVG